MLGQDADRRGWAEFAFFRYALTFVRKLRVCLGEFRFVGFWLEAGFVAAVRDYG